MITLPRAAEVAAQLARSAGHLLREQQLSGDLEIATKEGGEVVTSADRRADQLIQEGLRSAFPGDAVYSEETPDSGDRLNCRRVWIVDPLDGTSTYVRGGDEYCVSIGLSIDGHAVVGAIYNPSRDELVHGSVGAGVRRNGREVNVSTAALAGAQLSTSRRDLENQLLPELPATLTVVASMAYKLARVAAGIDDGVVSAIHRKEWGTCAGVALVLAGGGRVGLFDGTPVRFNRRELRQPLGMAAGGPVLYPELLDALAAAPLGRPR